MLPGVLAASEIPRTAVHPDNVPLKEHRPAACSVWHFDAGTLDVPVALTLAGGIAIGTWVGAKAAHALPTDTLRKSVALVLVLVGGAMLLRLAAG